MERKEGSGAFQTAENQDPLGVARRLPPMGIWSAHGTCIYGFEDFGFPPGSPLNASVAEAGLDDKGNDQQPYEE